jgi:prephenate dehydrogenase
MLSATVRRVSVIGTGLIGTSVALALRHAGVHVGLSDRDVEAVAESERMGAGVALAPDDPPADVVVIATPPSTVASVLRDAQQRRLGTVYTDVASTKARIVTDAQRAGCDLTTFVPGHPIAGRELSGPAAAHGGLFVGRPWALCPLPETSRAVVRMVTGVVQVCGGQLRLLPPDAHDQVVAAVSHAPHVISALLAARFADADDPVLSLAGKGLQDVTRIAAGSTGLWCDILRHNADRVAEVLELMVFELASAARALRNKAHAGPDALTDLLDRGNRGRERIAAGRVAWSETRQVRKGA